MTWGVRNYLPLHNCGPDWHYSDHPPCSQGGTPEHQSSRAVLLPLPEADSHPLQYIHVWSLLKEYFYVVLH